MTESCSVKEIIRDDETYNHRIQALLDKFGEVFSGLRSLSILFALHPENGRYMVGFGRTFTINMNDGFLQPI